jgi:hypothetical protein
MVEIFGKSYYIDIDGIVEKCKLNKSTEDEENGSETIDILKFDLIKMCIDTILTETVEVDESMGEYGSKVATISFKIAFNTLIKNNILIEDEDEQ